MTNSDGFFPRNDTGIYVRAQSRRGRPSLADSKAREDDLLRTAVQAFLELGYERASMNEIARRANASKATLYARYPDKEALFIGVVKNFSVSVISDLEALPAEGSARERLIKIGHMVQSAVLTEGRRQFVNLITSESTRFPELGRNFWENGPARMRKSLSNYFEQMDAVGLLRAVDCELMARQFVDLTVATLFARSQLNIDQNPSAATRASYVESAVDLFLLGYGV